MLVLTPIFRRSKSGEFSKCPRKRARFAKADLDADLSYRERRHPQQAPGEVDPTRHVVAMRRRPKRLRKGSRKVIETEINELCESGQRNVFREMLLDEFGHALLLPCRQAATNWADCGGFRSFQSEALARCGHGLSLVGIS